MRSGRTSVSSKQAPTLASLRPGRRRYLLCTIMWHRARSIQTPSFCCTRSEEHTSELQSLMRSSYAVFCLNKKNTQTTSDTTITLSHIHHRLQLHTHTDSSTLY